MTRTRVFTMTIPRRLIEQNLRSYLPLRPLPVTPAHCRARLLWCWALLGWNHADCGRIVFSDESSSNCVLTIIEDVSGYAQRSVLILLSLLNATQSLNQEMVWDAVSFDS
ncbi:hypothetical protein TNCV_636081 [Trichonephila clavipes]|nr:hypothetical protein TNCV_636081 [Trichonephila clavipes]